MLTVITAGVMQNRISGKKKAETDGRYYSVAEPEKELSQLQISGEEFEKFENFITILPPLILIAGVIIMHILNKIFLN